MDNNKREKKNEGKKKSSTTNKGDHCNEKEKAVDLSSWDYSPYSSHSSYWIGLLSVTFLSVLTRLYKISEPDHIVWDETHFGKFGTWYILQTFFFDVHPPLGKLLIGLFGVISGYKGDFKFEKPGKKYPESVNYVGMRTCCAMLGAFLPPLAYMTTWELTNSLVASVIAASLLIFDTGTLTLCQYILLDPILMFFIMAATYSYVKFKTFKSSPFSSSWWFWLRMTGLCIGCSFSVKYVGLFIVALVGLCTVKELWDIWGDLTSPLKLFVKHFISRAICLIVLPLALYIIIFRVHLGVLYKSGDGDGFYSSAFQVRLEGNKLHKARMPEDIAYGSIVTIKNHRTGGAYLHSHHHLYPENTGIKQQQVTCYSHKDQNNEFRVKKADYQSTATGPVELVGHGDLIRLEHIATTRNLHSHKEPAPISKQHYQVSGYGINGTGDANDVWRVVIHSGRPDQPLKAVKTIFQLIHVNVGCLLSASNNKKLPKWGYEQVEVTCNQHKTHVVNTYWNIEEITDTRLPFANFGSFAPSFLSMFMESHSVMAQGNAGLKPKEGEDTSQPWQWPINFKGQVFSAGGYRVYLLGNPVIFWFNLAVLGVYLLAFAWDKACQKRGWLESQDVVAYKKKMLDGAGFLFIGWALHYVPFWTMGRVLYFHHYFPALLYSSMLTGIMVDYVLSIIALKLPKNTGWNVYHTVLGVIMSGILYSFYLFHPLSYGMTGENSRNETSRMAGLRWMESWDI